MKRIFFVFLIVVLTVSVCSIVAKNTVNPAVAGHPTTTVTNTDPNSQPPPIIIPPVDIPPDSCSHQHADGCSHEGDHHDSDHHDDQDDQGENESSGDED